MVRQQLAAGADFVKRMATGIAAAVCGLADEVGTIHPGKSADLLVVGGNPLDDIGNLRHVERVMNGGAWL